MANKFVSDIEARLAQIALAIVSAKIKDRRALQKERSDLEGKLRRVQQ